MLIRCILPSQCPPLKFSSLWPCQAQVSFSHKPRRPLTGHATNDCASLNLYRQYERAASSKAGSGSAKPLNKPNQTWDTSILASHRRPALNGDLGCTLHRVDGRRRSGTSPTLPQTLLPPQQRNTTHVLSGLQGDTKVRRVKSVSGRRRGLRWVCGPLYRFSTRPRSLLPYRKTTRAQSRLQDNARVRRVKSVSSRRRRPRWVGRLYRTRKILRDSGKEGRLKRENFVSLSPWPKHSEWGSHVPMTRTLEKFNWDWALNFSTLKVPEKMKTWTSLDAEPVVRYYGGLRTHRGSAEAEMVWLQDFDTVVLWRNVMLWCLRYQKKQALVLLLATLKGRKYSPPRYAVSDSLTFLARHFLFRVSNPDPDAVELIWLLTRKFIEGASRQETERKFTVSQQLIHCVLRHIDGSRVLPFLWLLGQNNAVLHADTMLHFLNRFVDMGRIDLSIRLLDTIVKSRYRTDQVQMACTKLLRARFNTETEYTIRSNILAQILEIGVRPNIHMFNTILLNASESGDFANVWNIYGLAKENAQKHDLVPDSFTYNILVKGAVLSCDVANVNLVISEIEANREALQDVRLLSEVLKAISLTSPQDAFGAMLDFYKQYIDLRPLHELSLFGKETQASFVPDNDGVQPNHYVLSQMIVAYIKQHHGSLGLLRNYILYYQHVKENHPLIAPLAQDDAVPNAFIVAFGKSSKTLPHCLTVVKHMLELASQRDANSDTLAYSAPTVHTWSALVAAYLRNRQTRAAEKVLEMMRERGIEYNQVTWNTLISGYSYLQDVNAAVGAVKRMEAAGFEADAYTRKALGNLCIQDKVMESLKTNLGAASTYEEPTLKGLLPPFSAEEQDEAREALEWESKSSDRYLEDKYSDPELENGHEGLAAVA